MSSRRWRIGTARLSDDQVRGLVSRARANIDEILKDALDDEAGLARIHALHDQQVPAQPTPAASGSDEGGQVQAVCDRIAMLESTLAQAGRADGPSTRAAMYLGMARQFLFELRSGLAGRDLSADDAFRLLSSVRHDLHEADSTLRREQQLPLGSPVLDRIGELRELTGDVSGQLEALNEQVMRLFGHSDEPSIVPVPQH